MRTAVFAGSFDPITYGHMDIIERASKIFDKVVVVVMVNPDKRGMFELDERMGLIKKDTRNLENVQVDCFWGLLVDYMKKMEYNVLIKGIRNTVDFNYEYDMESTNKALAPQIETVFLMSSRNKGFISSSMVKQLVAFKGDISSFVSENVIKAIDNKQSHGEGVQ